MPVPLADTYAFERDVNPDKAGGNPAGRHQPGRRRGRRPRARRTPTPAAIRSTRSTCSAGSRTSRVFPNRADPHAVPGPGNMQAVPTSVEVGPDGHYYVSQLTGFPFPVGGANIFRVSPRGGTPQRLRGRLHDDHGPGVRARTGRCTCSRSTPTASSSAGDEGAIFAIVARRAAPAQARAARRGAAVPRRHHGRRRRPLRHDQLRLARRRPGRADQAPARPRPSVRPRAPRARARRPRGAPRSSASPCRGRSPASRAWA